MNILVEDFPTTILVDGLEYPIRHDFKTCLRVILAFEDNELTAYEKQVVLFQNLLIEVPENLEETGKQLALFLNGGKVEEEDDGPSLRVYSFNKDAGFIFSAFRQTHGVDLENEQMHWWKFLALFMDLGGETTFCSLVNLRKRIKTGKATKEERDVAREIGELLNVPELDDRTLEEKEQERQFLKALENQRT